MTGTTIDDMKGEGRSMGTAKFKNSKDVTNYTYVYIYTYTPGFKLNNIPLLLFIIPFIRLNEQY